VTPVTVEIKVRFGDVDHAKIVYYPRFFHYFHIAFEELFEQGFGIPYPDVIDLEHLGFPAVHTEADYKVPVVFGDVLEVRVSVARIGTKSVKLRYRAIRKADGVECVEGLVTTCCVDMRTFEGLPVPERYRELFGRYLEEA